MENHIKIVIADGNEEFCARLKAVLEQNPAYEVVGTAPDGEKAAELGLTNTHFVNDSGLHDENHYTTVREMAVILEAAMANERCRAALSAVSYTSAPTTQNPEGVAMINKFLYRIGQYKLGDAVVEGAKTGFTSQAMNCCASFGIAANGKPVVCVTAHAWTGDFCVEDHVALYTTYCGD